MLVTLSDGGYAFRSCIVLLCPPWHRRTGWTKTACCSAEDLRVTRAASPRSAWVKRTEQVRGEVGASTHVGRLSSAQCCAFDRCPGKRDTSHVLGLARRQPITPLTPAVIPLHLYATNAGCVVNVRHLLPLTCSHSCAVVPCSASGPVCYLCNDTVIYNDKQAHESDM